MQEQNIEGLKQMFKEHKMMNILGTYIVLMNSENFILGVSKDQCMLGLPRMQKDKLRNKSNDLILLEIEIFEYLNEWKLVEESNALTNEQDSIFVLTEKGIKLAEFFKSFRETIKGKLAQRHL